MKKLSALQKKKKKLVVGLMSGTSADGIDAVLAEIRGSGSSTVIRQVAFISRRFPQGYKEFLLHNSLPGNGTVDSISSLNILSAHFFADAVKAVARKARLPLNTIDLIGSHGQTIQHIPEPHKIFGKNISSTLQIGDPSTIAKLTGIVTVGDFRTADMAVGGQGAPLVPYFDYLMFRSTTKNRALLNIGGIANITLLKKKCTVDDVFAFDTGPGNMVIDSLMKHFYRKDFDAEGSIARKGKIHSSLLAVLLKHEYFSQRPPKSTGRELFGKDFLKIVLSIGAGVAKEDLMATLTEFTVLTVYDQYRRFLLKKLGREHLDELVISGGGVQNTTLVESLQHYFHPAAVVSSDALGISSDAKEALCFAVLANETIHEIPSNVPSVTGAKQSTVLGKICL
jgi:anhydro-N-acetylmuramic acid kinase